MALNFVSTFTIDLAFVIIIIQVSSVFFLHDPVIHQGAALLVCSWKWLKIARYGARHTALRGFAPLCPCFLACLSLPAREKCVNVDQRLNTKQNKIKKNKIQQQTNKQKTDATESKGHLFVENK